MNWQSVDIETALRIHSLIINRAKTKAEVRDFSLLHSALERPKATFLGKDLYPDIFSKAAALLQSLCMNHPFTDGNKRTAWTITHKFLWDNGFLLKAQSHLGADFMVYVDNGKPDIPEISTWIQKYSRKKS